MLIARQSPPPARLSRRCADSPSAAVARGGRRGAGRHRPIRARKGSDDRTDRPGDASSSRRPVYRGAPSSVNDLTSALAELRTALGPAHPLVNDERQLVRYLQHGGVRWHPREGGLDGVLEKIDAHVAWRARHPTSGGLTQAAAEELAKGKVYVRGIDRKGRPVIVVRPAAFDPQRRHLQTAMRAAAFMTDEALRAMPPGVEQFAMLVDRTGYSLRQNWDSRYVRLVLLMLRNHYPGRCGPIYFYPVNDMARMAVRLVWPFMDARQRDKLSLVRNEKALHDLIAPEDLPPRFGGTDDFVFDSSVVAAMLSGSLVCPAPSAASLSDVATSRPTSSDEEEDEDEEEEEHDEEDDDGIGPGQMSWRRGVDPKTRAALRVHLASLSEPGHLSAGEEDVGQVQSLDEAADGGSSSDGEGEKPRRPTLLLSPDGRGGWKSKGASAVDGPSARAVQTRWVRRANTRPSSSRLSSEGEEREDARDGAQLVLEQLDGMNVTLGETGDQKDERAKRRQLLEVLDELVTSESNYCDDLGHICDLFLVPLAAELDSATHATVFSNLKQIQQLHVQLAAMLDLSAQPEGGTLGDKAEHIAAAFTSLLPFFKMYSTYAANFVAVAPALRALRERRGPHEIINAGEAQSGSVSLEALLFRPVQRM